MPILNKADLVESISKNTAIEKAVVAKVVDALQETVMATVARGVEVKLMGFLAIEPSVRSARELKNPRTGETVEVPASKTVRVRAMKHFLDRVRATE